MASKPGTEKMDLSRRRLLGGAVGLGAAGVGLGSLGVAMARPETRPDVSDETHSTAYHETEHIRRYYRTTW